MPEATFGCDLRLGLQRKKYAPAATAARPPIQPMTTPAMAPPESPVSSGAGVGVLVSVLEAEGVVEAEFDVAEDEVEVATAASAVASNVREVARLDAEDREEYVSFNASALRFAMMFGWVAMQILD